jgi:hypothetical protein
MYPGNVVGLDPAHHDPENLLLEVADHAQPTIVVDTVKIVVPIRCNVGHVFCCVESSTPAAVFPLELPHFDYSDSYCMVVAKTHHSNANPRATRHVSPFFP